MDGNTSGNQSYPSLRRARLAQIILAGIGFVVAMDIGLVALLIEPMKHELELSDVHISLSITTAYYISYGLASVPAGMLVDRFNRPLLQFLAVGFSAVALIIIAFSQGIVAIILGRVLMSLGAAITLPAAMSLISDLFAPERRAFASSTYMLGQRLGVFFSIMAGGLIFSILSSRSISFSYFGTPLSPWRMLLIIFSVAPIALLVAVGFIREPARQESAKDSEGGIGALWIHRRFLVPTYLGALFMSGILTSLVTWTPPMLTRLYGLQPGEFAVWYGTIQLSAGLVAVLVSGRIVELTRRRGGRDRVMLPAAIAAFCCAPASCLGLWPDVVGFAVSLAFFDIACGIAVFVPIVAISFRVPNESRGTAIGLHVVFASIGGAVASTLVARTGEFLGGEGQIGVALAVLGVPSAALAGLFYWKAVR